MTRSSFDWVVQSTAKQHLRNQGCLIPCPPTCHRSSIPPPSSLGDKLSSTVSPWMRLNLHLKE
ncbi:hypothetical protein HAX54_009472, partial [Datura stramonium]|nr:hypothetical protein [Datura stramonium]